MFLSKKFRQLPHLFTLNLFLAQVSTPKEKNVLVESRELQLPVG